MITIYIPGLAQKSYEYRRGDAQIIHDNKGNAIVIDGGESDLCNKLFAYCRSHGITHVTYILSHWHYDHDIGLQSFLNVSGIFVDRIYIPDPTELANLNDPDAKEDRARANRRITLANSLHKTIVTVKANAVSEIKVGAIRCLIWRRAANRGDYDDYEVNNTSMCCYFPDLYYLTTGDTITSFEIYLKTKPGTIKVFKVPHHGNACTDNPCNLLKQAGAQWCWYNDWEPSGTAIGGTGFSKWGAGYCKKYFTTVRTDADILMVAKNKKLTITKGSQTWTFDIPYCTTGHWEEMDRGWKYINYDGTECANGPYEIDGKWYYFDDEGYRIEGWYKADDGYYRYLNPYMYINAFITIDDKEYYVDGYGRLVTGWFQVDSKWYCSDENGVMRKGWYDDPGLGMRYLEPVKGYMYVNTIARIDGKDYAFDGYGRVTEVKPQDEIPRLNVIDIASYQASLDLTKVAVDGVIIKATQGTSYVNPCCNKHYAQAKQANILRGLYHYANGSGAVKEADFFVSQIKGYIGDAILALDWEGAQNSQFGKNDVAYCKTFLDRVYELTGVRPLIYMSKSVCRAHDWSSVAKHYGLWCAQYASMNTTGFQTKPWTDGNGFGAWGSPAIYQYSSRGRLEGYNGNLDLDLAYMTRTAWGKYAKP